MRALFGLSITASTLVSLNAVGSAWAQRAPGDLPSPDAALTASLEPPGVAGGFAWDWGLSNSPISPAEPLRLNGPVTDFAPTVLDDWSRTHGAIVTTLTITRYAPFEWDGTVNRGPLPGYRIQIDSPALALRNPYQDRAAVWPDSFAPNFSAPLGFPRSGIPSGSSMTSAYHGVGGIGRTGFVAPLTLSSGSNLGGRNAPSLSLSPAFNNTGWGSPLTQSLTASHAAPVKWSTASPAAAASTIGPLDVSHPTGVPSLSSNPGASYTIYLDFAGFSFSGGWGGDTGLIPGDTPAFMGETTSFTSAEQASIRQMWARVAEKYSPFSVNVTTVDPFVTAGMTGMDADRQAFYDQKAQLMHTVIGGNGSWVGGGGISWVGVTKSVEYNATLNGGAGGGFHTNFVFSVVQGNDPKVDAEDAAHENGHGFGLQHQGDWTNGNTTEYSTNNNAQGTGSYAPIMGASYYSQRGLWRLGNAYDGTSVFTQNDPQVIAGNPNMSVTEDGNGHTRITATPLPLTGGNSVDFNAAKGVIVPASSASPNPIGAANYTTDFFSFASAGGTLNVTLFDSAERLTPGQPDLGGTLSSTLTLLDASGNVVTSAPTNYTTLSENITRSLPPGLFYLQVASTGGQISSFDTSAHYYDMGDYFLTGVVPAPEPGSLLLAGSGAFMLFLRRRRTPPAP